jgi:hypothetical protein
MELLGVGTAALHPAVSITFCLEAVGSCRTVMQCNTENSWNCFETVPFDVHIVWIQEGPFCWLAFRMLQCIIQIQSVNCNRQFTSVQHGIECKLTKLFRWPLIFAAVQRGGHVEVRLSAQLGSRAYRCVERWSTRWISKIKKDTHCMCSMSCIKQCYILKLWTNKRTFINMFNHI